MPKLSKARHVVWVAPLSFVLALPAQGQAPDEGVGLEEVVVTARKREENLQDVPLAVTAFRAEELQRVGIKDIEGIISRDPSLGFDRGIAPYDTRIVIRGLSPTRGRPNVATLVDGVDVSSEAIGTAGGSLLINPRLVDIERVEIVKGPQSALYGRSAFAGAISYITKDPGDVVGGEVSTEYADNNQYEVKGSLSLPLTETLGVRLNGYKFDDAGFYKSTTGQELGGGDGMGGSFTLNWEPNESYSLKFRTEYADDHFAPPAQAFVPFNGVTVMSAAASSCRTYSIPNPAGGPALVSTGPLLDASCQFLDVNPALPANTINLVRLFETSSGNLGAYDDMTLLSFRGQMVGSRGLRVAYNKDFTRSTDGVNAPDFSGTDRQVLRLSAVQNYKTSFGTFSSLTGYTKADVDTDLDFDKTDRPSVQQTIKTDGITEQFSQELRFTSDFDGPLQFMAGAQYWTERADQFDRNISVLGSGTACTLLVAGPPGTPPRCAQFLGPPGGASFTSTDVSQYMDDVDRLRKATLVRRLVDHQSFYLEFEWSLTDTLTLIAEARYVDEDNTVVGPVTAGNQGPGTVILCGATGDCRNAANIPYAAQPGFPRSFAPPPQIGTNQFVRNDSYTTPKATLQWRPSDNLNVYGSYSEGRKPGGFGTLTLASFGLSSRDDVEYESEKIKVYELGAKWISDDRSVSINGAAFLQDFTDKQVSTQLIIGSTLGNRITNAGGGELQGLELAGQWRITDTLTAGFGVTHFLKYEFTDYTTLTSGPAEIARVGNCTPVTTLITSGTTNSAQTTCSVDRAGKKFEDTPETAAALNLSYRKPMGDGGRYWFADADYSYVGERFVEDDNSVWLQAYSNINLRFGLGGDRWSATLFVDNATDDDKVKSAGTTPAVSYGDVRSAVRVPPAGTLPANLRNPLSPFSLAIPGGYFAEMPKPRTFGLRVAYEF
jgi:outer membrane receptor protein involved in Fe transport